MTKRRIIFLAILLFIATTAFLFYRGFFMGGIIYETVIVERGDLSKTITDEGVFEPLRIIRVGSKIPGQITEIFADFNTLVKAGDVLAKVESELSQRKLEKSMMRIETLNSKIEEKILEINGFKIALSTSLRNLEQNKFLAKEGIISMEDFYSSEDAVKKSVNDLKAGEAKLNSLEKEVKEAEADLRIAELEFDDSFIKSPIDGIVLEKFAEIGQTVSGASFQVSPLFEICPPLTRLKFIASVNEVNISGIYVGQEMIIKIGTIVRTDEFVATIREIHNRPSNMESGKVDYDVVAFVDNLDLRLKPAMKAMYFIDFVLAKNVLKVSMQKLEKAVAYAGKNGFAGKILVLSENGGEEIRSIREGVYIDGMVEVAGEIAENELIIVNEKKAGKSDFKTSPWQWKR